MTTTYIISFNLTTLAPDREVESLAPSSPKTPALTFATESGSSAAVEPAPPERPPAGASGGAGRRRGPGGAGER